MELHEYRFSMILRGGGDIWALGGRVYGRPGFKPGQEIHVSTPQSYDPQTDILTTVSGSRYKLIDPAGNKEKIIEEIQRAIEKGYEIH